jgi:hypothetical protein
MYPQRDLARLAAHKAYLRRGIAQRRRACVEYAVRAAQPLLWLDRVVAVARRLSPVLLLAALPVGAILRRTVFRRLKFLGSLLRWGPIIFGFLRSVASTTGR